MAVALLSLFAYYIWSIRNDFVVALRAMRWHQAFAVSGLLLLQWGVRAWRDRLLFAAEGHLVPFRVLFSLNSARLALNYLPFKAGTLSTAGILLTRFGVGVRDLALILTQQSLLNLLVSTALAAAAIWFSTIQVVGTSLLVMAALVAIALGSLAILNWTGVTGLLPQRVVLRLQAGGWHRLAILQAPERAASTTLALTTLICVLSAVRMAVVFGIVAHGLGIADALLVSAAMMIGPILALTPGGIGITEALAGVTSVAIGQSGQVGVMAASIDRLIVLGLSLAVSAIAAPLVWGSRGKG